MTQALDSRALQYAYRRIEDFALVNKDRLPDEKKEALSIWLDGIGLSEALETDFALWISDFIGPDTGDDAAALLGLAVGLFVHQFYES